MRRAYYVGPDPELYGEVALVMSAAADPEKVGAQFNSFRTDYCYGWHEFPRNHFEIDHAVS
jgi:hypothetical protein